MWQLPSWLLRVLLGVAASLVAFGAPARAQAWTASEEDSLLLELRSGAYRLGEPLRGYQTNGGICVDFADLIQALDLPIRLDKQARRATGWLFAEDQRFTLDRDARMVRGPHREGALSATAVQDTPEGWCVDLTALSAWFGVRFRPDLSNLAVVIESDRKLPFLEAIERKQRASRLRSPSSRELDLAALPRAATPYRGWRAPSVDLQLDGQWTRGSAVRGQFEALAAGEALGLSYAARTAGSLATGPETLRLRLYRNAPERELLGPLRATQIALGDVESLRGALTVQAGQGRGAFLSNRPLNRPGRFGVTTLSGTLPAGWDAELYRNGELRAYQADAADGRYRFLDIELLWGENDFEVVLYGPQGQLRRERTSVPVGVESLPARQTWYWAGVVDAGRDLVDLSPTVNDPATGWRWGVGVERGLDKRTTAGLEYQSTLLAGRRRHFVEASLQRTLGRMVIEATGAQLLGAGRSFQARALGRLGNARFDLQALWLDGDYHSELIDVSRRREYSLRLGTTLRLGNWRLPVEGGLRQFRDRAGTGITEWSARSALQFGRTSLTVEHSQRSATGAPSGAGAGDVGGRLSLLANTAVGPVRLRGIARVALSGASKGLESAQLVAETALSERSALRLGYEHDARARRDELQLGWVRQFDQFAVRSEARLDRRGQVSLGITLGFSLGPDPVDGGWRRSRERLAETGQVGIEVFRDENGDGARQADEGPVEGVSIEAGFRHSGSATNPAGRAVIDGLVPYVPVLVSIDAGRLTDPLLQPKGPGVVVVPRPGIAGKVSLALAPTGEIEAYLLGPDGEPRDGVTIELIDSAGRVIRHGQSDFDGYLLFDAVPYGAYALRVGAASAAALRVSGELTGPLRIDRAQPSQRLGRVRLRPLSSGMAAAGP